MAAQKAYRTAIVLSLNDRFIAPGQALIESIARWGEVQSNAEFVVLTRGLTRGSIAALEKSAARTGLPLSVRTIEDVRELGEVPAWAIPTCLRLYLGDVCAEFRRALYLDSDMLVLRPLDQLLDMDLQGKSAAAVLNHPPLDVIRVAIRRSQRGNIDGDAPYFNAGVLLVDVQRWHERALGIRSREFLARYPATRLLDQDAWNFAFVNDWCLLDKRWNVPAGPLDEAPMFRGLAQMNPSLLETVKEWRHAQEDPWILHYTGRPKPWETSYPWPDLRARYAECMLPEFGSDWPSTQPDGVSDPSTGQRVREFQRI